MGRHITVTVDCDWVDCDVHAAEGDGRVIPMTLSIDGKQAKEFLLCKPHRDEIDELLIPLMQAGIKAEAPSNGRRKASSAAAGNGSGTSTGAVPGAGASSEKEQFTCEVDGCGRKASGRIGLAQHTIKSHGFENLAAYEAVHGPAS